MNKEIISDKQAICLIILFIFDGTLVLPTGIEAGKDLWLAILLSIVMAIPMLLVYSNILSLFPGKDLFDILQLLFGNYISKFFILLYTWFAFHLGAIILRDFAEFISIVTLPETPRYLMLIIPAILCAYALNAGIEVLGRFTEFFSIVLILLIVVVLLLLIPQMHLHNIRPILGKGIKPVLNGAFSVFSFPFAETIIFTMIFSSLNQKKSPYKVYIIGTLLSGFFVCLVHLTNMLVLGEDIYKSLYFPTYSAISEIKISDFLDRIEVIIGLLFVVGSFVKVSICLLAAGKGITKLFNLSNHRIIISLLAILMINLSYILYDGIIDLVWFTSKSWRYYAFPFQVLFPLIILLFALIKNKAPKLP